MDSRHTNGSFVGFLNAIRPSRNSFSLYAKVFAWIAVVYIAGVYAQLIGDIPLLPMLLRLGFIYLSLKIVLDTAVRAITFVYRTRHHYTPTHIDSFTLGFEHLAQAIFWFIYVLVIIDVFIPLRTLLGSLTLAVAVTGLAFRDFVTNFMNGFNLMFSGKFQLGEYVQVGEVKGKIIDLSFTHVHIQTESQDMVFVPNNLVLSKEVINFSKNRLKHVIVTLIVDKPYYEYYQELQQYLKSRIAERFSRHIVREERIAIRVESIEKDSTKWRVDYQVDKYSFELETELKNATAELLVAFLTEKEREKKEQEEIFAAQTAASGEAARMKTKKNGSKSGKGDASADTIQKDA